MKTFHLQLSSTKKQLVFIPFWVSTTTFKEVLIIHLKYIDSFAKSLESTLWADILMCEGADLRNSV